MIFAAVFIIWFALAMLLTFALCRAARRLCPLPVAPGVLPELG
jgi:hypothetical protein